MLRSSGISLNSHRVFSKHKERMQATDIDDTRVCVMGRLEISF